MSDYFEHFSKVNSLDHDGRRSHWGYLDQTIGRFLPSDRSSLILDVGCGCGIQMEWLKTRGYSNLRGVDTDVGQATFARGLGLTVDHVADAVLWVKKQRGASLVILKDVLEHIPAPADHDMLCAIAGALGPGGSLYLSVPNANYSFAPRWRYNDATHKRSYTEHSLRYSCAMASLRVEKITDDDVWHFASPFGYLRNVCSKAFKILRRLEAAAEFGVEGLRIPLGRNLVAVAYAK